MGDCGRITTKILVGNPIFVKYLIIFYFVDCVVCVCFVCLSVSLTRSLTLIRQHKTVFIISRMHTTIPWPCDCILIPVNRLYSVAVVRQCSMMIARQRASYAAIISWAITPVAKRQSDGQWVFGADAFIHPSIYRYIYSSISIFGMIKPKLSQRATTYKFYDHNDKRTLKYLLSDVLLLHVYILSLCPLASRWHTILLWYVCVCSFLVVRTARRDMQCMVLAKPVCVRETKGVSTSIISVARSFCGLWLVNSALMRHARQLFAQLCENNIRAK